MKVSKVYFFVTEILTSLFFFNLKSVLLYSNPTQPVFLMRQDEHKY